MPEKKVVQGDKQTEARSRSAMDKDEMVFLVKNRVRRMAVGMVIFTKENNAYKER